MDCSTRSVINSVSRVSCLLSLVALVLVAGCKFGQLPNPNAKKPADEYDGAALQARVLELSENLAGREMRGEVDGATRVSTLRKYIDSQVKDIDTSKIAADQAWRFADVYRQLGDWQATHDLYVIAVKNVKDDDRRANDTIRLAEAKAMLGDVEGGVGLVRLTFDVKPGNKAPILLATLYEFAPAALNKGQDVDVALLIEDAIGQHLLTRVDPFSDHGKAFIQARRHHIDQAWRTVIGILRNHGDEALLREALRKADETLGRFARV